MCLFMFSLLLALPPPPPPLRLSGRNLDRDDNHNCYGDDFLPVAGRMCQLSPQMQMASRVGQLVAYRLPLARQRARLQSINWPSLPVIV